MGHGTWESLGVGRAHHLGQCVRPLRAKTEELKRSESEDLRTAFLSRPSRSEQELHCYRLLCILQNKDSYVRCRFKSGDVAFELMQGDQLTSPLHHAARDALKACRSSSTCWRTVGALLLADESGQRELQFSSQGILRYI